MKRKNNHSADVSPLDWADTLKALADESRLRIIRELLKQEATVQDLSKTLGIKIYNISRHLKILETGGLVKKRKEGVFRFYHITENLRSRLSTDNQVLDLGCCKFIFNGTTK
ncbi:MAG: winged helix-turn-helix transcriptional regulator [Nitrospirae bacterium]|nr:winged helix-turn-helix transcriptional regulator [Nitrospirota bacterium]